MITDTPHNDKIKKWEQSLISRLSDSEVDLLFAWINRRVVKG